jgi:hypothetical protein
MRAVLAAPVFIAIAIATKPSELHADEIAARMGFSRPLRRFLMMCAVRCVGDDLGARSTGRNRL